MPHIINYVYCNTNFEYIILFRKIQPIRNTNFHLRFTIGTIKQNEIEIKHSNASSAANTQFILTKKNSPAIKGFIIFSILPPFTNNNGLQMARSRLALRTRSSARTGRPNVKMACRRTAGKTRTCPLYTWKIRNMVCVSFDQTDSGTNDVCIFLIFSFNGTFFLYPVRFACALLNDSNRRFNAKLVCEFFV